MRLFDNCMNYKICILAAGVGSRMGEFTETFNKALIPIKGKPTICHIIENYDSSIEIVFGIGYRGEQLKKYIQVSYPNRKINFVEVDNYDKPGSGPGYSLLCCKDKLQCPFILANVDALTVGDIPEPTKNWFGVAEVNDTSRFSSVKIDKNNRILQINDKEKTDNKYAFTGIAGIKDYKEFWEALERNTGLIAGERQVSNGFQVLKEKGMEIQLLKWFDTGTPNSYKHALENYPEGKGYQGEKKI